MSRGGARGGGANVGVRRDREATGSVSTTPMMTEESLTLKAVKLNEHEQGPLDLVLKLRLAKTADYAADDAAEERAGVFLEKRRRFLYQTQARFWQAKLGVGPFVLLCFDVLLQ